MSLLHAITALLAYLFWRFVALNAGPHHHAYLHATWRAHINGLQVRAFLEGGRP
jgi:hypothetical protein